MQTIINPDDMNAVEAALALKDELGCKVVAFTMGPPPAEGMLRELMARVKANMRRTVPAELHEKPQPEADDGLRISRSSGMVYKNGRALELSAREFDILCFLSASPGRVFSREELMEQVWGYDYYGDLRAVDVAIRRLREKVEDEPASPKHIITKRGMGYYFAES